MHFTQKTNTKQNLWFIGQIPCGGSVKWTPNEARKRSILILNWAFAD